MAREPVETGRPYMPGYGTLPPDEGTGLLPWPWAVQRLTASHDYWLATVTPDGAPHVTPVWGVWLDDAVWFSASRSSRKARNLERQPRCTLTADNPLEPVIVEGSAERVGDRERIRSFAHAVHAKYDVSYPDDFYDPDVNATYRVTPVTVFGLTEADFTGSPTRWRFD